MNYFKNNRGFTFIGTMVGIAILGTVIIGIYGVFEFGLKVISQSRARVTASALAVQKMELVQNLSYEQVGTMGGIPSGNIAQTEIVTRNNINYTVRTTIGYVDDPFDGITPADTVPNDYKKVRVKVSWTGFLGGEVVMIGNVAPRGLESTEGGGNLLVSAFDLAGIGIPQADIHVVNHMVNPAIDVVYQTNNNGQYLVAGAPTSTNAYEITISKSGHSTSRTYGTDEVANPDKPHTTVAEGRLTEISFQIDKSSTFNLYTSSPWGSDDFSDTFVDGDHLSATSSVTLTNQQITLSSTTETGYELTGYATSLTVAPVSLSEWTELSWTDDEPDNTDIKCQLIYASSTEWVTVSDIDLPGNSAGFDISPVDLSGLAVGAYPQLRVHGYFNTSDASTTPALYNWSMTWRTIEATPIGNVAFNLRGNKVIGTNALEQPVYKYSGNLTTNGSGQLQLAGMEWDTYTFTIAPAEGLNLIETDPITTPPGKISLIPDTVQNIILTLDASDELLVNIKNETTLLPVFNAQVRLVNAGLGYDITQFTNEDGKTLFIPLENGTYAITITADAYINYTGSAVVSGDTVKNIYLSLSGPS